MWVARVHAVNAYRREVRVLGEAGRPLCCRLPACLLGVLPVCWAVRRCSCPCRDACPLLDAAAPRHRRSPRLNPAQERTYSFTMERRFGGPHDGKWYTARLQADGCSAKTLYGII